MSGDYASRLKEYPDKGVCGLPENVETKRCFQRKLGELTALIQGAKKNVVVLTGAGISTAAGISDFRGPTGIWTLEAKQKKKSKAKKNKESPTASSRKRRRDGGNDDDDDDDNEDKPELFATKATSNKNNNNTTKNPMAFDKAQPTLTHRALYYLWKKDHVKFIITQNVDGLHRRSGLPRSALAVLHGCVYTEKCEDCGHEYFRDQEMTGISFARTGRHCSHCKGYLRDTLLDWEDHLPEDDWMRCQKACDEADLIVTLGTSLRMEPAASLVLRGKQYVVVNLQVTPYDDEADLILRYKVDDLMQALLLNLGYSDDWIKEYPDPPIERDSKPIGEIGNNTWWQTPVNDDAGSDDEDD